MPLKLKEVPLADRTVQRSRRRSRTRRLRSTQFVGRKSRHRSRSSRGVHSPARSSHSARPSAGRIFREHQVRLRSPSLLPITRSKRCTSPKRHRRSPGHSNTLRKKADREAQNLISKLHACRRRTELNAREAPAARSQVQGCKLRRDWRDPEGDDWSRELRAFSPERREEQARRRAMAEEHLARLKVKEEELKEDTDKVGVIVCEPSDMGARGLATSSTTAQTMAEEEEVPRVGRHSSRVRSPKAASTSAARSSTSSRKLRQNSLFGDDLLDHKKSPLHGKFRSGISLDSKPSSDAAQEVTTTRSEEEVEKGWEQEDLEREMQEDGVEEGRQEEKTMVQKEQERERKRRKKEKKEKKREKKEKKATKQRKQLQQEVDQEQARREEQDQAKELLVDFVRSFRAPVTVSERETGVGAAICTLPEGDNMSIEEDDSEEISMLQRLPFKPAVIPAAGAISTKPASMFRDDSVEELVSEQLAYTPTPVATAAGAASTAHQDDEVAPTAQQKLLPAMFQDDSGTLQGESLTQLVSPAGDADSAVKPLSAMFNDDSDDALATPSASQPQPFQDFSDKASSKGSRGSWQESNSDKDWDNMELSEVEEILGSSDPTVSVPQACDTAASSLEVLRRNPPSEVARLLEVVQALTKEDSCVTFQAREYWVHGAWHLERLREDAEASQLLKELQTDATGLTLKLSAEDYWEDGQWDLESLREDVRWKSSLEYDDVGGKARDTQQLRDERPEERGKDCDHDRSNAGRRDAVLMVTTPQAAARVEDAEEQKASSPQSPEYEIFNSIRPHRLIFPLNELPCMPRRLGRFARGSLLRWRLEKALR